MSDLQHRRRLVLALLAGLGLPAAARLALAQDGAPPGREAAPPAQGLRRARGQVRVNGRAASSGDPVRPGDRVSTGRNALAAFVIGQDAFLLRASSQVEFSGSAAVQAARLVTGKLLGVFAAGGERRIITSTATIGIRGTGAYVEAQPRRTYFCLCYGTADIATRDGDASDSYSTTHHESPRYIYADHRPRPIVPATVVNHRDAELVMLEALVGRRPPQGFMDAPRKY